MNLVHGGKCKGSDERSVRVVGGEGHSNEGEARTVIYTLWCARRKKLTSPDLCSHASSLGWQGILYFSEAAQLQFTPAVAA